MAWANQRYSKGNYVQANQPAYNGQHFPQHKPEFKKSGAKYSDINKGKNKGGIIVNAWNVSKNRGMITATATPVSDEIFESEKSGKSYQRYAVEVFYKNTGAKNTYWVLMNVKTQVIGIPELGMCISPVGSGRTKSGKSVRGYFGTFNK